MQKKLLPKKVYDALAKLSDYLHEDLDSENTFDSDVKTALRTVDEFLAETLKENKRLKRFKSDLIKNTKALNETEE